jgi:hypothetical protein
VQERFLFSWRLLLIDSLLMLYLLAIFAASLYLGINVTSTVAAHAMFKYVPSGVLSPSGPVTRQCCITHAIARVSAVVQCRWVVGGGKKQPWCG